MNSKSTLRDVVKIKHKEQSITNLTKLLQHQSSLARINLEPEALNLQVKKKKRRKNKKNNKDLPFSFDEGSKLMFPAVSRKITMYRKSHLQLQREKEQNQQFQKHIDEYLQKMNGDKLIEKYQTDHKSLVQEACKEIKRKIKKEQTQLKINKSKTKLHRSKETIPSESKKDFSLHTQYEQAQKKKTNNNLYLLDLDRLSKQTELKERQRRRTQRHFVRKLSKLALPSFYNLY